jgi:phosphatidylinositol alpha-mannosyltransferase
MRVGIVCPYSFDVPGGVQNHVRDLAVALHAQGHEVGVLAPGECADGLPSYVELVGKADPVPYNGSVARLAFGPRVASRTARWLRTGDFDVVHVHEPIAPSVSLLTLWTAEQPLVATFHTAIERSRAMASVSPLVRPSLEKLAAQIAVSEVARDTLVHHLGGGPVVIPNGLFCDAFASGGPEPVRHRTEPVVVFLGRIDEPRKGLHVLLDAWPQVTAVFPTARLLVAGRGDRLGLAPSGPLTGVEFLGQVSDDARGRLLRSATVCVVPALGGESFGIVLVEAMAAGAAVVASDLPAFRSVLAGDCGRVFPPGDSAALAETIVDVVSDATQRHAMTERASIAVRRFDWSRVIDQVVTVYDTATRAMATR